MTDKEQIIIDGVDITKCVNCLRICTTTTKPEAICRKYGCCSGHNCLYKQHARKTQECEALKKRNEDNERFYLIQYAKKDSEVLDLTHKLNVKTQECEIWKNQVLVLNDESITVQVTQEQFEEYQSLRQECEELKKKCNIYTCGICGNKEDCNKLYKTLSEIKEIVEPFCNACQ